MIAAAVLLACPHLAVPAQLMYHVAQVESDANQYAIGVVDGRLLRQPTSMDEAIATARSLEAKGYNFSVGVAQVNHANLKKYGLDTYEKAFSICDNLLAGSRVLAQCYSDAGGVWGKAFSCYYSGDFTTGFRDGYVQRVLTSLSQSGRMDIAVGVSGTASTPVLPVAASPRREHRSRLQSGSAAYRVAIRTFHPGAALNDVVTQIAPSVPRSDYANVVQTNASAVDASTSSAREITGAPGARAASASSAWRWAATDPAGSSISAAAAFPVSQAPATEIFVPQVVDLKHPAGATNAANTPVAYISVPAETPPEDSSDDAFVF